MTLKTLLLGSAAAFSVVGGAQAADLAVADSVSYVKVCSIYGAGFFYIPGSDTCLKITGYAQLTAWWMDGITPTRDYTMVTEGGIGIAGMWNGAAGEGSLIVKFKATDDNTNVQLDKAYATFAGFLFGYAESTANTGGALDTDSGGFQFNDFTVSQFGWHGSAGPVSLGIAIEKGSNLLSNGGWGTMPTIAGYLAFSAGPVAVKFTALAADEVLANPYGFAVNATGSAGPVGLQAYFGWVHDDSRLIGGTGALGDSWAATLSAKVPVGAMSLGATFSMLDEACAAANQYLVAGRLSYGLGPNVTGWLEVDARRNAAGTWTYGVGTRLKAALPGT